MHHPSLRKADFVMWYSNDYQRIFMDMHLNDSNPEEYLSQLDTGEFVNMLQKAGATSIVVKAKSHVGLHYWPSQLGRMHEGLKRRNLDYVGEMISKGHAQGLHIILYLSQIFDNYAYDNHPAWRIVDEHGRSSRDDGGRYGLVCPNNLEYRKYVAEILSELATHYQFEGMFLDMPFWPRLCYCASCRERFYSEHGHDIPRTEDWDNPVWRMFAQSRQRWMEEFAHFNTQTVKHIHPEISIEHNFSAIGASWRSGDAEPLADASDYAGGDYYGGYLQQTFMCKYYNSITPNKPFCYITSRCDPNLYFHTVSRTDQDLMIHAMNTLVHNGAFSICDAMNPDGTLTTDIYESAIPKVFHAIASFKQYVSGDIIADISVLYHTERKSKKNFIQSPLNIAEVLREYNIAFNVIGSRNLNDLKTPVLSINDVECLSDQEMEYVENYVRNGGNLFVTGALGHNRLQELIGVKITGQSIYNYAYLNPAEGMGPLFPSFNRSSPYPIENFAWESTIQGEDVRILATLSYPYTRPGEPDFAAIHSNPPGIHTDLPGVVKRSVDKGSVIWVAAPLELTHAHYCRSTVFALLNSLIEQRSLISNAPDFVEIVAWKKNGKTYLSVINQQNKTPVYPINGIDIILPEHEAHVLMLTQSNDRMNVQYIDDRTIIHLPPLEVFHLLVIE